MVAHMALDMVAHMVPHRVTHMPTPMATHMATHMAMVNGLREKSQKSVGRAARIFAEPEEKAIKVSDAVAGRVFLVCLKWLVLWSVLRWG